MFRLELRLTTWRVTVRPAAIPHAPLLAVTVFSEPTASSVRYVVDAGSWRRVKPRKAAFAADALGRAKTGKRLVGSNGWQPLQPPPAKSRVSALEALALTSATTSSEPTATALATPELSV